VFELIGNRLTMGLDSFIIYIHTNLLSINLKYSEPLYNLIPSIFYNLDMIIAKEVRIGALLVLMLL